MQAIVPASLFPDFVRARFDAGLQIYVRQDGSRGW
jgi:hypothetical protein